MVGYVVTSTYGPGGLMNLSTSGNITSILLTSAMATFLCHHAMHMLSLVRAQSVAHWGAFIVNTRCCCFIYIFLLFF